MVVHSLSVNHWEWLQRYEWKNIRLSLRRLHAKAAKLNSSAETDNFNTVNVSSTCDVIVWHLFVAGETFPNKTHWWVDVRDVALAHIQAYEIPAASGRHCLVGSSLLCSDTMSCASSTLL